MSSEDGESVPQETDDTGAPGRFADAPAAVNTDLTETVDAEDTDQDNLDVDPLEEGMDPPEDWAGADKHGVTAAEQEEAGSVDEYLAAERPDTPESGPVPADADPVDPDADPSARDVPTSGVRFEDEDTADPGGVYR